MENNAISFKARCKMLGIEKYNTIRGAVKRVGNKGATAVVEGTDITVFFPGYAPVGSRVLLSVNHMDNEGKIYASLDSLEYAA